MFRDILARIGTRETPPSWSVFAVVTTIIGVFLAIIIGTTVGILILGEQPGSGQIGWIIGMVITIVLIVQLRRADLPALRLSADTLKTPVLFLAFVSLGVALVIDLIVLVVGGAFLPTPELLGLPLGAMSLLDWVLALILLVIAQPVAEELVFRGVAQPALRAGIGAYAGLFITAAAYAVFHFGVYPPNYAAAAAPGIAPIMNGMIAPLLAGLYFGAVRAYTGSTRAAIIAHAVFGLFAVAKILVGF